MACILLFKVALAELLTCKEELIGNEMDARAILLEHIVSPLPGLSLQGLVFGLWQV